MSEETSASANEVKEVFPHLRVKGVAAAIEFYTRVFGAQEKVRFSEPGGRIGHSELLLGSLTLMLSDEFPEYGLMGPQSTGTGAAIKLHVVDADAMAGRAVAAGATMIREPADEFYGKRECSIRDPFGHEWTLGHEIEKVSNEEIQRRLTAMFE